MTLHTCKEAVSMPVDTLRLLALLKRSGMIEGDLGAAIRGPVRTECMREHGTTYGHMSTLGTLIGTLNA